MRDRFYDNTRISDFRTCPRKYYFRHALDWTYAGWTAALVFGSSWHEAMDTLWARLNSDNAQDLGTEDVVREAYDAFLTCWMENNGPDPSDMDPDQIKQLEPRTPMIALEMLYEYVLERREFIEKCELIAIEQPFAVPLDPTDDTLFYVGRLDKVVEYRGEVLVIEHKTTSLYRKDGPFRSTFVDSFSPNSQIDGYLHAIHSLYGKEAKAVWVDAALVHKKVHDGFKFIPIERQIGQLESWLWSTRYWIDRMEMNWHAHDGMNGSSPYMPAFPQDPARCQDFARNCPYMDLCKAWSNPTDKALPPGYAEEVWSPFDRLELEKIGLSR